MASPSDLGFDLLPPDPALLSPDLALDAALAPVVVLGEPPVAPLGKGWSFDFVNKRFFRNGNSPAEVFDIDNLRVWIEKTLRTARYAHPIYSDAYGLELDEDIIGQPVDAEMVDAYESAVRDALLVHDRIAAVDDFYFQNDPFDDALYVTFTVTLDGQAEDTVQVSSFPITQAVTSP